MAATCPASKAVLATALAAALLLGGCAPGDIQLNGKIFDAVGLNSSSKPKEAQVAERAPLVVPPGLERLPPPGSGGQTETVALAEIKDDDANKNGNEAERQRAQAEYCKKNYEIPKQQGQDVDSVKGPLGDCRPSALTGLTKVFSGGGDDQEQ